MKDAAMKRVLFGLVLAAAFTVGCARPFDIKSAPGFVEVHEEGSAYDYRAVVPDGVAVAVRAVDIDEGQPRDVAFWERAFALRTRELDGYALVSSGDARSLDGSAGRELVFGHDEQGKPYVYRVRLFVSGSKLIVAEAGGARDEMERWHTSVDWMLASVKVR
jgi:hypothetical protein